MTLTWFLPRDADWRRKPGRPRSSCMLLGILKDVQLTAQEAWTVANDHEGYRMQWSFADYAFWWWWCLRRVRWWWCQAKLSVCLSVRLSATFGYVFHIGWSTSKTISRMISLRFLLGLTPLQAIWSNANTHPQNSGGIGVGSVSEQKTCNICEMRQDRTKVTMTN